MNNNTAKQKTTPRDARKHRPASGGFRRFGKNLTRDNPRCTFLGSVGF